MKEDNHIIISVVAENSIWHNAISIVCVCVSVFSKLGIDEYFLIKDMYKTPTVRMILNDKRNKKKIYSFTIIIRHCNRSLSSLISKKKKEKA